MKGRFEDDAMSPAGNAAAQAQYRRAIEIDPQYAAAYSALGGAIWNRSILVLQPRPPSEAAEAVRLYQKAIELDPGFAVAHAALGGYAMFTDWDWARAEREYRL